MDPHLLILIGLILASAAALVVVKKFVLENSDFWMSMGIILADLVRYERAVRIYPFYVHAWNGNEQNIGIARPD